MPRAPVVGVEPAAHEGSGSGGGALRPILECVRKDDQDTYTAFFGYHNERSTQVTIPAGAHNGFFPGSDSRGQPTVFQPGRSPYHPNAAFSVRFDGLLLVWTLRGPDGQTRIASASPLSPRCAAPAPSPTPAPTPTPTPTPAATPTPPPADPACVLPIWGPRRYTRTQGWKTTYEDAFVVPASARGPFTMRVENGEPGGQKRTLAWVRLNGQLVVRPRDHHSHRGRDREEDDEDDEEEHRGCGQPQSGWQRDVPLTPGATARLKVTLVGAPGSHLTLRICGRSGDASAPTLSWTEPATEAFTSDATPRLVARYADADSGVDPASFKAFLDEADVTGLFTRRSDEAAAELPDTRSLSDGSHVLRAEILDRAGNRAQATSSFRVDSTPPSLAIAEPVGGAFLSAPAARVRVVYADAGASPDPTTLRVLVNGQDRSAQFQKTALEATAELSGLASGVNHVLATVRDKAGNEAAAASSFSVDTQAPALEIAAPLPDARLGSRLVDVEVRYSDDQALDLGTFAATLDGHAVSLTPVPGGAIARVGPLADGRHALAASVRDRAGNAASATRTFDVDTRVPVLSILQPTPGASLRTATALVEIDFHESPDALPGSLRVLVDGIDRTGLFAIGNASALGLLAHLGDGPHEVVGEVRDGAGNRGTARVGFLVDTRAPSAALVEPSPGAFLGSERPRIALALADACPVDAVPACQASGVAPETVRLFVDGVDVTETATRTESGVAWTSPVPLSDGAHVVRVQFADRAGNETSAEAGFAIDTLAPTLAFESPQPDSFVNDPTPELRLRFADAGREIGGTRAPASGADPASLRVFLRTGGHGASEIEITGALERLADVARGDAPGPLGAGTHRLRAVIADRAGNAREAAAAFEVDVTPPALQLEGPLPGSFVPTVTPALAVAYSDDRAGVDPALVRLVIDGVDRSTRVAHALVPCTEASASLCGRAAGALLAEDALTQGPHALEVTVVDRAGNAASSSGAFSVDSIPPVAEVLQPASGASYATASVEIRVAYRDVCVDAGGAACPASGVDAASVRILLDGADRTADFAVDAGEARATLAVGDGPHALRVEVMDLAGQPAQATASFQVDTRPPTVAPELADGAYVRSLDGDGNFEIRGSIHDLDPGVSVQCRVGAQSYAAAVANGQFSCRVPLQEGGNSVSIVAKDANGHETTTMRTLFLDRAQPQALIEQPSSGTVTAAQTLAVRVAVTDASPVTVSVNEQPAACEDVSPSACLQGGSAAFTAHAVPIGDGASATLTATVSDAAGNTAITSVTVGIDRGVPALTITAPSASFIKGGVIEVAGEGADETPVMVDVNGIPAAVQPAGAGSDGQTRFAFTARVPAADGPFRVTATARDAAGNPQTAFRDFNVDSAPPAIAISSPPQPFATNATSVTIAGTVTDASAVSVAVNGESVPCDGAPECAFSASVPLAGEGGVAVPVTARDAAGNESSAGASITVDRTGPILSVESPAGSAAVGSLPLAVVGLVSDATAVSVTVNGQAANLTGSAWQSLVPALGEGLQTITATAVDAAGNQTTVTRDVVVDLGAPVLVLASPESGFLTALPSVTVTGTVQDRSDVSVRARGTPFEVFVPRGSDLAPVPFTLGPLPLAEGDNGFVIEAVDATSRSFEIPLTVTRDQIPPTLELVAPESISRGRPGQASGAATDLHFDRVALTLSCVSGSAGPAPCALTSQSFTAAGFSVALTVPEGAGAGDSLLVAAQAFDRAGNTFAVSRTVRIVSDGAVVGQVLADTTGLPLESAAVRLEASGGGIAPQQSTATTDERGRYSLPTAGTNAILLAGKAGFTSVEREVGVVAGSGTVPVDARLTELAAAVAVGVGGGSVRPVPPQGAPSSLWSGEKDRIEVVFPPGPAASYRLTPLSGQGLPNLLPLGWSPVLAFDLRDASANPDPSVPMPVSASATVTGLPNAALHVVRYDFSNHAWRMVTPELTASGGALTVALPALGAYALVVADVMEPPMVVVGSGAPLPSTALAEVPVTASSTGRVEPAVVPPTGGTARGLVAVQSPLALPSGTVIQAEVTEQYTLVSGAQASEEARTIDIVLYRADLAPAGATGTSAPSANALGLCPASTPFGSLCASFPITPSRTYTTADVTQGKVHLDVLSGRESVRGSVGGSEPVALQAGMARLFVPKGALPADTAFVLEEQELSPFLPAASGLTPVAEVVADFNGQTLALSAELSFGSQVVAPGDTLLLAKVERLDGIPHLAVVALAQLEGERVVSKPYPGLPGLIRGGRYVLYRVAVPLGFVAGTTSASAGAVKAVVEPAADDPGQLPFIALADVTGHYMLAAATGLRAIRAMVPGTPLLAASSVEVGPSATTTQDLVLAGAVTTATVNPADGALGMSTTATLEIASPVSIRRETAVSANVVLQRLPLTPGEPPLSLAFRLVRSSSGRLLSVVPESRKQPDGSELPALEPSRSYRLTVSGLIDEVGGLVLVPTVTFRTKDFVAPFYDSRKLVFSMPNADGIVSVTAPGCHPEPGCFYPGTTVLIINSGNGVVLSLTAGNDGTIASELPATINDTMFVTINDPLGNQTSFTKGEFVNETTGETGIGPGGGTVRSLDGATELRIPEGALEDGVSFEVRVVPDAELATLFPDNEHETILAGGHLGSMVEIEPSRDTKFRKEVDLAFPVPDFTKVPESQRPASPNDASYVVHRRVERCLDGAAICPAEQRIVVFETIDDAKVEGEGANARVVTASFPFSGIQVATSSETTLMVLGWYLKDAQTQLPPYAAVSGKVLRARFNDTKLAMEYVPVEGALVSGFDLGGERLTKPGGGYATSQKDGTFALTDPHYTGGQVQIYAMLGDEVAQATAYEITGGWAAHFRKGATANITFPEQAAPSPPPLLEIHVRRRSDAKDVGGYAVAGAPLAIAFTSGTPVTAQIDGNPYRVTISATDLLTWEVEEDYVPAEVGTVEIVGTTRSGQTGALVTVSRSVRILAAGGAVDNLPTRAPRVTSVEPKADDVGVPVSAFLQVFFSEPVRNIRDVVTSVENATLVEIDQANVAGPSLPIRISGVRASGDAVANITSGAETVTSLSIEPLLGLKYGQRYRVSLKGGIQDLDKDAQQNPAPKSLQAFSWAFDTFGPEWVGGSSESTGSPGIAVIGSRAYLTRTNSFANGTLEGYRIDDPVLPAKLPEEELFSPRPYDIVGAGDDSSRLVAIATGSTNVSKPASVLLYDVTKDADFRWVGAATLASSAYEGFITRLAIHNGAVYAATVRRGIQVVDIAQAKAELETVFRASDAQYRIQTTKAYLNSDGVGFGHSAVVQTLPLPKKANATDYYLNDLKAMDIAGQTVVVVTGEPGLVVASPVFGAINYNGRPEKTESIPGGGQRLVSLEWGHALALTRLADRDLAVVVGIGKVDGASKTLLLTFDLANLAAPAISGWLDLGPHADGLQPVDVLVKDTTALVGLQNGARDQGAVLLVSLADIAKPIFTGRLQGQDGKPLGGRLALTDTGLLLSTAKAPLGGATPLGGIRTAAFDTVGAVLPVNPVIAKFVPGSNLEREETLREIPLQMRTYPRSQKVPEVVLELFEGGSPLQPPLAFALNNGAASYTLPKGLVKDVKKDVTARLSFTYKGRHEASAPRLLPITAIRLTLDSNNDTIVEDQDDEDVLQDPNKDDPAKAIRLTFWESDARFDPKPLVSADPALSTPTAAEFLPVLTEFALLRLQLRAGVAPDERIGVVLKDSQLELVEKVDPVVGWPNSCLGDPREYKGKEHLCHAETADDQGKRMHPLSTRPKPSAATAQGLVQLPNELLKKGDNLFLFRCKGQGREGPACAATNLEVVRLTDGVAEAIDARRVEIVPFKTLAGMMSLRRLGNPDSEDPADPHFRVAPEARSVPGWAPIPANIKDITVYVHGFNVTDGDFQGRTKRGWFATWMKRLYWAGHKVLPVQGGFTLGISWPGDIPGDIAVLPKPLPYYAEDEFNALQAGLPFGGLVNDLRQRPGLERLNILAHSLGNMVVNNALKEVPSVAGAPINYVMNQAAIASEAFEDSYSPQDAAEADESVRNLVQHGQDLGFPSRAQGLSDPDVRWVNDERTIEKIRQTRGCLTGPTTYSPGSRSGYCQKIVASGDPLPMECRCDEVTRYFSLRYSVNPELDPSLQEPATTASTPFFTTRWGKLARNNDPSKSLKGAWTQFFSARIAPDRTPDGIRIFNTYNVNDAVLRIDAGPAGFDTGSTTLQFHVWRVGQIKGKPFKAISSVSGFALGASGGDADDPLDQQKWWTLELPGRPSWWRSTAEEHVLEHQRGVWNGRAPDGATLPEGERLKAIARRTRLWAEIAIWYPALSAPAGAVSLSRLSGDLPGVDLLALPREGLNINFSDIAGQGGFDISDGSNLSHSYLGVLPLHQVWRGYRAIRNIFRAALP